MLYRNLTGLENLEYFSAPWRARGVFAREEFRRSSTRSGLPAEAAAGGSRLLEGDAPEGRDRHRAGQGGRGAAARRADLGPRPEGVQRILGPAERLSDAGVAVLMATHDLFRAKESGTRVGIMKHGQLVETMRTEEIGHADLERLYLEHMHD